jgi:hypothetical protein
MGSLCSKCMEKKEDNTPAKNIEIKDSISDSSPTSKRFSLGINKGTPELLISERDLPAAYETYSN